MNGLLIYRFQPQDIRQPSRLKLIGDVFRSLQFKLFAVTTQDVPRLLETSTKGFFRFALLLEDDPQLARFLQIEHGIRPFNDETAMTLSMDRAMFAIGLRNANIPGPLTIPLPYAINVNVMQVIQEVKGMMLQIRYPVLIKNRYPTPQEKIYFVRDENELITVLGPIGMQPLVVQAYVPQELRKLYKVLVIGRKIILTLEVDQRDQKEVFNLTQPPLMIRKYAIETAISMGADIALVSIFYLHQKNPYVYSVQTNLNIVELQLATGVDIVQPLSHHIRQQLKK